MFVFVICLQFKFKNELVVSGLCQNNYYLLFRGVKNEFFLLFSNKILILFLSNALITVLLFFLVLTRRKIYMAPKKKKATKARKATATKKKTATKRKTTASKKVTKAKAKTKKKVTSKKTAAKKPAAKKVASRAKKATTTKKKVAAAKKTANVVKLPTSVVSQKQTKAQIFTEISENTGVSKADVKNVFAALRNLVERHLKTRGSGQFIVPELGLKVRRVAKKATKARKGRNPFTGEEIMISAKPARKAVRATVLKNLKEVV